MIKTGALSQAIERCVMKSHWHYTERHPQGALLQTGSGGAFFSEAVARGFEYEAAYEQFYRYAKTPHVTPFGVFVDNTLVAGATIAIHDGICDLGVTSTLPAWRGRGLQKALLTKRLAFARDAGAELATVTTTPGSVSDLNAQKMGFQIAYTRVKFRLLLQESPYENSRVQ